MCTFRIVKVGQKEGQGLSAEKRELKLVAKIYIPHIHHALWWDFTGFPSWVPWGVCTALVGLGCKQLTWLGPLLSWLRIVLIQTTIRQGDISALCFWSFVCLRWSRFGTQDQLAKRGLSKKATCPRGRVAEWPCGRVAEINFG